MITVPFVKDVDVKDLAAIEAVLDTIDAHKVCNCNWPGQFPYSPEMKLRMFHTGNAMILRYDVREKYTAALVSEDNGQTWTDSCCEFFLQLSGEEKYYNIEATCAGRILVGYRPGRQDAVHAPKDVLQKVLRYPSLGSGTFAEKVGDNRWSLTLVIPANVLFCSNLKSFCGVEARFNCYKCGDNLSEPHFLSLAPIDTPSPDFHRPEFFVPIRFDC